MKALIDRLSGDIGDPDKRKEISEKDFKALGYKFTENNIEVESTTTKPQQKYIIHEVADVDRPSRVLDFCYLYSKNRATGLVLAHKFSRYADLVR